MDWAQATAWNVGLVSLFGGLITLDRRNAFQLVLSQPLVVVTLLGLIFGQLEASVWLGALLQLLWMSSMLFGANVPENETVASVIIAGTYFVFRPSTDLPDAALFSLIILLGVPFSSIGRKVDIKLDDQNLDLVPKAESMVADDRTRGLFRLGIIGLLRAFIAHGLVVAMGLVACLFLTGWLVPYLSPSVIEGLTVTGMYLIPSLGLAVTIVLLRTRRAMALATTVFSLIVLLLSQSR